MRGRSLLIDEPTYCSNAAQWPIEEPSWHLYQDNRSIWAAVMEQCDAARHSIRLEQYIFGTRGVGRELLDLLAAKARQGIDVRVLADGLGSRGLARSEAGRELVRSGGTITLFNGVSDVLRHPMRRAHRLHRKTLISDGSRVMVGGSCYEDRMSTWRDTMIRVEGPVPPAIGREFERASGAARGCRQEPLPLEGAEKGGANWQYALSGPGIAGDPDLRREVPDRIAGASDTVSLTTPYLVPNRRLWRAFTTAVRRGVRVQILMPARSDHGGLDIIGPAPGGSAAPSDRRERRHLKARNDPRK